MSETRLNESAQANLKAKLFYESLSVLAHQGKASLFISLANGGIVYFFLNPLSASNFMLYWLMALVVVSAARFILVRAFFSIEENSERLKSWLTTYIVLICLSALCWGVLPLTELFRATNQSFAIIVFVIAGMSAGALVSLYARLDAVIPYLAIILFPLIYALSVGSAGEQTEMAILAGLFLVMLVRSSYGLSASARKTMMLEVQNSELFDFLLKSNRVDKSKLAQTDPHEIQ